MRDELKKRKKACVYTLEGKSETVISGEQTEKFIEQLKKSQDSLNPADVTEIKGHCACPGFAKGIVKIINSTEEMAKMQKGEILVSQMTNPEIVPAMKKAGAIVTDVGGLTCHAAIISRELRIPCIIGSKIATRVLKDGDLVEVDATKGILRKL